MAQGRATPPPVKHMGRPGFEEAETPQGGRGSTEKQFPGLGGLWDTRGLDAKKIQRLVPETGTQALKA